MKIDQLEVPLFFVYLKGTAYFYVNIIDRIMNKFVFVAKKTILLLFLAFHSMYGHHADTCDFSGVGWNATNSVHFP